MTLWEFLPLPKRRPKTSAREEDTTQPALGCTLLRAAGGKAACLTRLVRFVRTGGKKQGETLLHFLKREHLVQPNAKPVLEGAPEETRRRGDGNNAGALLGKWEKKHLIVITALPQSICAQRHSKGSVSASALQLWGIRTRSWHQSEVSLMLEQLQPAVAMGTAKAGSSFCLTLQQTQTGRSGRCPSAFCRAGVGVTVQSWNGHPGRMVLLAEPTRRGLRHRRQSR